MPMPNSLPWMESVDAKMIRAHEHLETLERETSEYLSTIKPTMVLKTAPKQPWPWLVMWVNDYIPPIRLSVLLGDCVHNMRSALDNLICGLARTVDPSCACKGTAFPYSENEKAFDANIKRDLVGVPSDAQKIIKQLQPWCDTAPSPNPLLMLNKLSNIDKHRSCNFALAYNRNAGFRIHGNDGTILEVSCHEPLYLGEPQTITLPIKPATVTPSARVEASGTFALSLREEGSWNDLSITHVLQLCFDHVETKVISKLKPFFETRSASGIEHGAP
jgi:hypothetical protein